jgi:caffeoyl-CoA O-methyltransferase
LIAADNTLWDGYVLDQRNQDEETRALRHFNDVVASDDRILCVLLTIRDGVTLIRRRERL